MATPFPFVAGAVLEAAELNAITELPINDQTASYVLVAGDAGKRVIMNAAGATTITVNNSLFVAGQMVFIANKGAGTCTVTAGAGVTVNVNGSLAVTQYGGGTLLALSASSFVFFPGSVKNTLSVEYLLVGGGGGGGKSGLSAGGGGAGGFVTGSGIIGKTTYTIKVGAGGTGATFGSSLAMGNNGTASGFLNTANGGGGGDGRGSGGLNGASGGGAAYGGSGGTGISGEGNNGGTAVATSSGAGGGGGSNGVGSNGSTNTGGAGGAASTNNYTGSSISYSGGGGGGGDTTGGAGGTNAGAGGSNAVGGNATANRGGGGGGGGGSNDGGNGGSGRVVVRWLTANAAGLSISTTGSPSTGTDGSYTWYAWDSTGTLVVA